MGARASLPLLLAHIAAIVTGTPGCTVSRSSCDGFVAAPPKSLMVRGDVAEGDREVVRAGMRDAARSLTAGSDDRLTDSCRRIAGMPTKDERRRVAELLDVTLFRSACTASSVARTAPRPA